ncbi:MAG: Stp1/IreP family PP2C-type Ser/Thr phosphatase [Eubacteriales bacterium]|nr:Stp1/IreP family PP2C-type Ser/Thr phosphatase [Eubacteriales bacterium]
MEVGYYTDKGRKRTSNEDAVRILNRHNVFLLADGVGGNRAGEIASNKTLDVIADFLENNPIQDMEGSDQIFRYFENAVDYVNEFIKQMAHAIPECAGMATTLVIAYVRDHILYIANVGDSRVYFIHGKEIHQITVDHTYVNDLVMMGVISRSEAEHHKKKNVITRAIGANSYNNPDCFNIYIEPEDKILLCSDGLYDELSEEEMLQEMNATDDMKACAKSLVDKANAHGGNDNISVICVSMVEENYE